MPTFAQRVERLPRLGVGISGEFDIAAKGIDACWMKQRYPGLVHFYEYGGDLERGLDDGVRRWAAAGEPTTYHFLDINLEERLDLDRRRLPVTQELAGEVNASSLWRRAGRWPFGSLLSAH